MIAAIQAGGRSLRMSKDKAWLEINGRPMIEHVLAAAQVVAERLLLVVNPANAQLARYEELAMQWQAELLPDRHDFRGPLGGLETALQQSTGHEPVLLLACDLPFVTAEFLLLLRTLHDAEQNELTVPLDRAGQPQLLTAIYAASCQSHVTARLARGELKMRQLLNDVRVREVSFVEYAHLAGAATLLRNLNSPADLDHVEQ